MQTKKEKVVEFLDFLTGTTQYEINQHCKVVGSLDSLFGKEQVYFVCGLGEKKNKRSSDRDIVKKQYFFVDIDIRLDYFHKTGDVLSQEELDKEAETIVFMLECGGFGDYSYWVNSGNGIHLYYIGDEVEIGVKDYYLGVQEVFDKMDAILESTPYSVDRAPSNIGRLSRLPGTYNPRKKSESDPETKEKIEICDLGNYECVIAKEQVQISKTYNSIVELGEQRKKRIEEERIAKQKEWEEKSRGYSTEGDEMEAICKIPLDVIVCKEFAFWRKGNRGFFYGENKKEPQGLLYHEDKNLVTHKGCSVWHRGEREKTYNTFSYVMARENLDSHNTFLWFEDHYSHIKDIGDRAKKEWIENKDKKVEVTTVERKRIQEGFVFPAPVFDPLGCLMAGELVTIVAEGNSGKTTFALDIIAENEKRGKKGYFINLEFSMDLVWKNRRLFRNGLKKKNLTDIDPMQDEKFEEMERYVKTKLSKYKYTEKTGGIELVELQKLVIEVANQGNTLIVIDSLSKIGIENKTEYEQQKKIMMEMQGLAKNLNICIILVHHTNKAGQFAGIQKIYDDSNVFLVIEKDTAFNLDEYRRYRLIKDKLTPDEEIDVYFRNHKYVSEAEYNSTRLENTVFN